MATKGILEGFNVGHRVFNNALVGDPQVLAGLGFGFGSDIPSVGGAADGGLFSTWRKDPDDPLDNSSQYKQQLFITQDNTSSTRGYHTGAIRVGFTVHDVEPPLTNIAAHDFIRGKIWCYAQTLNGYPVGNAPADKTPSTLVPQPTSAENFADQPRGYFRMDWVYHLGSSTLTMILINEGRVIGGGLLADPVQDTTTYVLSAGDFLGIELEWHSSVAPDELGGTIKPVVTLKGRAAKQTDFSDAQLHIMAQHDYDHPPKFQRSAWLTDQIQIWNIWGIEGKIRDPLAEGIEFATYNSHFFKLSHLEFLDGT